MFGQFFHVISITKSEPREHYQPSACGLGLAKFSLGSLFVILITWKNFSHTFKFFYEGGNRKNNATKYNYLDLTFSSVEVACSLVIMGRASSDWKFGQIPFCAYQVNNVSGELTLLKNRQLPSKGISSLKIRRDGKVLVGGSWDSTIRLFSWLKPQNLKPLGALKFHEKPIDTIDVTSGLIAAGSSDGYVTIWNVYK